MEANIKSLFESWGFKAEKIEETNEERPDFLVDDGSALYLVELKTREDEEVGEGDRNSKLDLGEIYTKVMPLIRKNRISGIVRKVQSQLATIDEIGVSYRLAWFAAVEQNQYAKKEQILATLYGITRVFDVEKNEGLKPCYYFQNSEFHRYRDILDGAILSWENSAIFCLNSHSPRYEELKATNLFKHFGKAVKDPVSEERNGLAYIVDSDVNRGDEMAVMNYLQEKYNSLSLMNMNIGQTTISAAILDE